MSTPPTFGMTRTSRNLAKLPRNVGETIPHGLRSDKKILYKIAQESIIGIGKPAMPRERCQRGKRLLCSKNEKTASAIFFPPCSVKWQLSKVSSI